MSRAMAIGWAAVAALSAALLIPIGNAAGIAHARARAAAAALNETTSRARELAGLRAGAPRPHAPGSGLAPRVLAALTRAGLPSSALAGLSPESPTGDGASKRQRAVITVGGATLPQIGAFLEAWRRAEPEWVVSSLELAPQSAATVTPGADLPLRTTIGIEAVYLERSGGER